MSTLIKLILPLTLVACSSVEVESIQQVFIITSLSCEEYINTHDTKGLIIEEIDGVCHVRPEKSLEKADK